MYVSARVTATSHADNRLPRQPPLQRSQQLPFETGITLTARNQIGHDLAYRGTVSQRQDQEAAGP